ncbi:MAG: 50S ribosomal protein L30 [archaeon]
MKIAVILIRSMINSDKKVRNTLMKLRLKQKFVCVLLNNTPEILGMLTRVKDYTAFGEISEKTLKEMILKRGKHPGDKKVNFAGDKLSNFIKGFLEGKGKLEDIELKNFFRLHPPRGGFKKSTKLPGPKGILGKNPKINELIEKML